MIDGDKIRLRPPAAKDTDFFLRYKNDIILQSQLLMRARPKSEKCILHWLEQKQGHDLLFLIEEIKSQICCGLIELKNIEYTDGYATLRIALLEKYQGLAYGGEAMDLLETYASEIFNVRKVMLQVLNNHTHAISAYVKQGYVKVGILHQHFYLSDQYHDVLIMEKLLKV